MKKLKLASQIFIIGIFLLGLLNQAQAEILWQENFDNQADWQPRPAINDQTETGASYNCSSGDCSSTAPDGWDYHYINGLWWGPDYQDTVRINNEHSHGIGKSFVHHSEDTVGLSHANGWNSDGQIAKHFTEGFTDVYISLYMQVDPTWTWSLDDNGFAKIFRISSWDPTISGAYTFFSGGGHGPIYVFDMYNTVNYGWRQLHAMRCAPQSDYYYCPDNDSPSNYRWAGNPGFKDVGSLGDGAWHKLTFHFKMNTEISGVWQADGVFEFWKDDVLEYAKLDKKWIYEGSSRLWNLVDIGGNVNNHWSDATPFSEQWYALDDLCIATTQADLTNCFSAAPVTPRADVDQQNGINTTDAYLTLRNSLGLNMNMTNWQPSTITGDVNCDNTSNSTDAYLILRYSLGLSMNGTGWCIN
jgi:hypothetical protein